MRALVLVQGINEDRYLKPAVKSMSSFNSDLYDKIVQVKTEQVFDESFFKFLPGYDKYGDIYQYFKKDKVRRKVSRRVTKIVDKLRKMGYTTIDLMAHSLGTVISLTSKAKVDTAILMGSPLSFGVPFLDSQVRKHTKKYLGLQPDKLYYLWSPNDRVCKHYNKDVKKLLKRFNPVPIESTSNHKVETYIQDLVNTVTAFQVPEL